MPSLPAHRIVVRAMLLAAALTLQLGVGAPTHAAKANLDDFDVTTFGLGGDFALTNQDGKTTGLRDFRGKVVVLFFGYTYCPDVCPLTLTDVGRMTKALAKDATKVQPLFITI